MVLGVFQWRRPDLAIGALRFVSQAVAGRPGGRSVPCSACGVPGDRRRCPRGYRPSAVDGRPCDVPLRPDCPRQDGAAAGLVQGSDTLACYRLSVRLTFGLKGANAPLVSCVPPKPKTPVRRRAVPRGGLGAGRIQSGCPKGAICGIETLFDLSGSVTCVKPF